MALTAGARLGSYEVQSAIGAGGMGEVYRARDTKLDRAVAIKILPESFAHDPERLVRFEREAKTLAALNHPNIAIIHGFEDADGIKALVMELVEGPTLADRIAQDRIPLDEALPIAKQIAEALKAAHEQGLVHRDLKPANIKLRPDGTVKVLDFGLAKAVQPALSSSSASLSPTITTPAMTQAGIIVGTAAYMAPEQAKGREADARSDVWSFGCVLYEMLTGRRAFDGEDVADTLAAVLRGDPDWSALPADVPTAIRTLLRECLVKDRRHRIADLSTALFVIDRYRDLMSDVPVRATAAPHVPIWRRAIPVVMLIIVAMVAAYAAWTLKPSALRPITRFSITLAPGETLTGGLALSPDGTRLAYAVNDRLYLRSFDRLDAEPITAGDIPSLAGARSPFFSPDGLWLGFWEAGQLKKVAVTGGAPIALGPVRPPPQGVTWTADNTILFGHGSEGIWRLSGDGGTPERIIAMETGQRAYRPELLPDGRTLLYTLARTASWDEAQIVVQPLNGETRKTAINGGSAGHYLPTGHLVYALGNRVLAVSFDPTSGSVSGGPVPVIESVFRPSASGAAAGLTISAAGTLAYVPPVNTTLPRRNLVWVARDGREQAIQAPPRTYLHPRVSPDGTRVAVMFPDEKLNLDIWVWEFGSQTSTRITSDPAVDGEPIWMPDGQKIIFTSRRTGEITLFSQAANAAGKAEPLVQLNRQNTALPAISPDGRYVVLRDAELGSSYLGIADLRAQPDGQPQSTGGGPAKPLVKTEFEEYNAEIAPNSNWLAYQSNSSGTYEVYVRPFPDAASAVWTVSTAGGVEPVWSRDGRELFYRALDGGVMRVSIVPGSTWKASAPTRLFDGGSYVFVARDDLRIGLSRTYDVSPDGQKFLMLKNADAPAQASIAPRIVIVQNWFEELKRLVPTQ